MLRKLSGIPCQDFKSLMHTFSMLRLGVQCEIITELVLISYQNALQKFSYETVRNSSIIFGNIMSGFLKFIYSGT